MNNLFPLDAERRAASFDKLSDDRKKQILTHLGALEPRRLANVVAHIRKEGGLVKEFLDHIHATEPLPYAVEEKPATTPRAEVVTGPAAATPPPRAARGPVPDRATIQGR